MIHPETKKMFLWHQMKIDGSKDMISGACHMDSFSNLVQNEVYFAKDIILPSI